MHSEGNVRVRAIWLLAALVAAAAVALYVGIVRDLPSYTDGWQIPWWGLALAFAAAEVFVIHAHIRGSAHTLSLSEVPLVIGLLLATPQDLVLAQILGPLVVLLFTRGTAPVKIAFNVAQFALTATISVVVLHALMPAPAEIGPGVWTATFAAVGAGALVAAALVLAVISLAEGGLPSAELLRVFGADLVVSLTNTSIGLVGATLMAQDWSAGWLILPPAAVLILAYRAYLSEHTKHQSLDFLYGVARSLSRAPDIENALVGLLEQTREAFRVRNAEIILFGGAGDTPLRTSLDASGATQSMQSVPHELATALRACLRDEHATVVTRVSAPPALAAYLEQHQMSTAAIAPVTGETRLVGVMLLGERLGATSSFSTSDLRLFETLAGHAGMSLEFDRLEQAIRRMRELQGALERQAYRDTLTDLANRALFMRRVHESLSRPSGSSTVLFLDLDDFKRINDDAGHAAGDAVLMAAAERIRSCVRPTDLAARLGGDEFAVLLEDADAAHGEEIAQRILGLLSEAVPVAGQPCWVRASIGIASAGARAGLDADGLMRHADIAMYRAKEAGKGQVRAFTTDMHPNALTKAPSRSEILAALARGEFIAHYQPIVHVGTGEIVAAEALVRWNHPSHGLLPPSAFVPAAEATGTIPGIDHAVLEQACARRGRVVGRGRLHARRRRPREPERRGAADLRARARRARRAAPHGPRAAPARAGADRERADRGDADGAADVVLAARSGGADRPGRLRHGLLLARLPADAAGRHPQGREAVRRRRRPDAPRPRAARHDHRARLAVRGERGRRGDRAAGPARRARRPELRHGAGLPVRAALGGGGAALRAARSARGGGLSRVSARARM